MRFPFAAMNAPLPARVQTAIRAEQVSAERAVGWVQLSVVGILAAVHFLAPQPDFADYFFTPLPYVLAAYAVFTLGRLVLSYRIVLPHAALVLSIVADMALLLGAIWSMHLQYGQPPAFYLKAQALLYVFIFIALRALRFEARYVVIAGLAAAAGWLGLIAYAAFADPRGLTVTNDFVTYLSTPAIMWSAEFDKLVAILLVTAVLAMALARARAVLVRAAAGETATRDLTRFFAPEVARRITAAEMTIRPGEGEMRDAATLFIDLRGFTALTGMLAPGELIKLLADYQRRMVAAIRGHGGSIDKFLGDGIMASFGAAMPSAHYAADALRAVDAIVAAVDDWRAERMAAGLMAPAVGAAVAAGPVLFGAVGDEERLEYTVIGDAVNLAAKLEKQTKAEKVRALTTADAYALALAQGYEPPVPRQHRPGATVGGVAQPLDLVVLAG